MTEAGVQLSLAELGDLVADALSSLGLNENERDIVSDVLIWAELRGNSQGLGKIVARAVVPDPSAGDISVTRRSPCVTHIDGNSNLGMVVMQRALEEALRSAADTGIGIVGTRGTATSTGAIGYYAERAAELGFLCMIFGGTPKAVAPCGSVDAIFGTNPLAFAIPTDDGPLLIDMGTSAETWFGLLEAQRLGKSIAPDTGFDPEGNATTDPGKVLQGAIRAFGGAKGSALALIIEVLTGPLVGGAIAGDKPHQSGNLLVALDPDLFGFGTACSRRSAALLERIRRARPAPDREHVQIPGERSRARFMAAEQQDRVTLDKSLYDAILDITRQAPPGQP